MSNKLSNLLLLLGLIALAVVGWLLFGREKEAPPPAERPPFMVAVTLAPVEQGTLAPRATVTGTVVSGARTRIGFERAGRIAELAVDAGSQVDEGALLVRLDPRDAEVALARAAANEDLATRELEQVLSGARAEEKARLAAELEASKADADLARRREERGRDLAANNVISSSDYDGLVSTRDAADARVRAAAAALAEAEAGARTEEIAVQRAMVELRRTEVQSARRELEKTALHAPFPATVVRRIASLGDSVSVGSEVLEIVDRSRREVEFEIQSTIAAQVGPNARVELSVDEFPDWKLVTQLDVLVPVADEASRTFRGIVRLSADEDPEQRLKPGMFVRGELSLRELRDVALVPSDAVRLVPSGSIVVRAKTGPAAPDAPPGPPAMNAEWVAVRVLASFGGRSAVAPLEGTFAPLDQVVVIGSDMAFPGAPLFPRPAATSGVSHP